MVSNQWFEERARYVTLAAALAGLVATLELHLVPALLAGLLVHELVHVIAPRISWGTGATTRALLLSVGLLGAVVIAALGALGLLAIAMLRSEGATPAALLARMADIVDASRASLPHWIGDQLPADAAALGSAIVEWMRAHTKDLEVAGKTFGAGLVHVVLGMVIGAMVCFREARGQGERSAFLKEAGQRVLTLAQAFRGVVFAQVKISAVNTALTAIYLAAVLPLLGVHLPLTKTMIAVTFVAGLLPVVGNLISNTVIVIVSLSYSPAVALGSLGFLVVVHKLEYFLNARIVGGEIKAAAWELLCAMLVFEAAFGLTGLIAAPIFYAYIKAEMRELGWL